MVPHFFIFLQNECLDDGHPGFFHRPSNGCEKSKVKNTVFPHSERRTPHCFFTFHLSRLFPIVHRHGIQSLFLKVCILFSLCMMAATALAADASPDVPLKHPVYEVLDRFSARGWVSAPYARPLSRQAIARLLHAALQVGEMTRTERGILDRLAAEFAEELALLGHEGSHPAGFRRGDPLWAWRDSAASVSATPLFRQQIIARRGDGFVRETVSQTYVGGIVEGRYRGLGFRVRHFEAREWTTGVRLNRSDVLAHPIEDAQLKGDVADFREGVFQLVWSHGWLTLDGGKGTVDWGPGRTGNLLLGDHAPSMGLFRLRASHGRVRYTHLAGSLHARHGLIDTTRRWIDNGHVRIFLRQKRLAAHRLEIDLPRGFTLGLHESVIYGDRGFEPLYVLPVSIFAAAQNHLENQDNLAMGADLSFRPGNGLELYGAWFFDDMMKFSPGAFSNQVAFQVGIFWVDPLGLADADVRAEYVRVEPFVYAHNHHVNTYEHYDALLGHPIGPNADLWHIQGAYRFSPALSARLWAERRRHGENPVNPDGSILNIGGNAQLGRRPTDAPVRQFMSGDVTVRTRLGLGLSFEPVRNWALQTAYARTNGRNVQLPIGVRGPSTGHEWTATLDVHFY